MHKAQKTDHILSVLASSKITPVFVPAGCTSIVQPLDVVFNAPFKKEVEVAAMEHMQDNLESYLNGKISAGKRRVLTTKWVGVRAFKKCGISVAADKFRRTE